MDKTTEQIRKEIAKILGFWYGDHNLENSLINQILSIFLDQTKDDCHECGGRGIVPQYTMPAGIHPIGETRCFSCLGTGKVGDWHPERLTVISPDSAILEGIHNLKNLKGED